jgi:hypothetical protein
MAVQVNIAEAEAKLSALLDRALAGEEIVIARAGKPLREIPNDALFEPMDPEDFDAAEAKHTDEFGITLW